MQVDKIGDMSRAELRRFIVDLLLSDPGALPNEVTQGAKALPSNLSDGDVPVWDASKSRWVPSSTKNIPPAELATVPYSKLNLASSIVSGDIVDGTIVDADVNAAAALAISKLAGYPSDIQKALFGDGSWNGSIRKFYDNTLGGNSADVDITSIPATGTHLLILQNGRGDNASSGVVLNIQFNGDTAANYSHQLMSAVAATQTDQELLGTATPRIGRLQTAGAVAGSSSSTAIFIPNYAGTTFNKNAIGMSFGRGLTTTGGLSLEMLGVAWFTAGTAINRVRLIPGAGNFIAGTRTTLYILGV